MCSSSFSFTLVAFVAVIAGPKFISCQPQQAVPCSLPLTPMSDIDLPGGDLNNSMPVFAASFGDCTSLCTNTVGCARYTYSQQQQACWLKNNNAGAPTYYQPTTQWGSLTSAFATQNYFCSIPTGPMSGIDLVGGDLPGMPVGANSFDACTLLCSNNPQCTRYTFSQQAQLCWIKTDNTQPPTYYPPTPTYGNLISAFYPRVKICPLPLSPLVDIDLLGGDLNSIAPMPVFAASFSDCTALCASTTGCTRYTYSQQQQACWLKDSTAEAPAYYAPTTQWGRLTSGYFPADAQAVDGCSIPSALMSSIDFVRGDLPGMPVSAVQLSDCTRMCRDNPQCSRYTYSLLKQKCWLKADNTQPPTYSPPTTTDGNLTSAFYKRHIALVEGEGVQLDSVNNI